MADLDRLKVIKGLEEAYRVIEDYVPSRYRGYSRLACCDAITLLREQEPVEPTAKDEAIRVKYNCGGCGYLVGFVSTIHDDMQYRAQFCPECGRKVKWDA